MKLKAKIRKSGGATTGRSAMHYLINPNTDGRVVSSDLSAYQQAVGKHYGYAAEDHAEKKQYDTLRLTLPGGQGVAYVHVSTCQLQQQRQTNEDSSHSLNGRIRGRPYFTANSTHTQLYAVSENKISALDKVIRQYDRERIPQLSVILQQKRVQIPFVDVTINRTRYTVSRTKSVSG